MNNYLTITAGTPKYLRCTAAGYETGRLTPQLVTRSLTSKAAKSYATGFRYWQVVARVKNTETGSYASISDIESWDTYTGTMTLTDLTGNVYNVMLVNGGEIKQLS